MTNEEVRAEELKIVASIRNVRLQYDLLKTVQEIADSQPEVINEKDNFITRNNKKATNARKEAKIAKLNPQKEEIEGKIADLQSRIVSLYGEGELMIAIDKLFALDEYGVNKLLFAINMLLDNEYTYVYARESLKKISKLMYNNENKLDEIYKELETHYKLIGKKGLSGVQKKVLITLGAATLALVAVPLLAAAAPIGIAEAGAAGVLAVALGTTAVTGAYICMDAKNRADVKKEFRKLDRDSTVLLLAIKCMTIKQCRDKMPEDKLKEELDQIFALLADLKGDVDYMLYVEKDNIATNKEKLEIFHNLDANLLKIFNY